MRAILLPPYTDDAEAAAQHPAIISLLETCPIAGEGVNRWLFCVAVKFHPLGIKPDVIEQLLEGATLDCGRYVSPTEIERAVKNSAPGALRERTRHRIWPKRNFEQIEAIGLGGIKLADLRRLSPVPLDSSRPDSAFRRCNTPGLHARTTRKSNYRQIVPTLAVYCTYLSNETYYDRRAGWQ